MPDGYRNYVIRSLKITADDRVGRAVVIAYIRALDVVGARQ